MVFKFHKQGIGSESQHTTMHYNGMKCMVRDELAGIPNLKGFSEMSNPNNFLYIHFYIEDKHD